MHFLTKAEFCLGPQLSSIADLKEDKDNNCKHSIMLASAY